MSSTGAAKTAREAGGAAHGARVDLPDLHLRNQLRAAGFVDDEVRRFLRAGELSAVRRGSGARHTGAAHRRQVWHEGEFDGEVTYGRLLRPGQSPGVVVFAEKRREDALRDEDLGVVRWIRADLGNFAPTATRLRARFRRA